MDEFAGCHNNRPADTGEQVRRMMRGMDGKRLRYQDLVSAGLDYAPATASDTSLERTVKVATNIRKSN